MTRLCLQDRHLLIEDFQPSKEANLKERCPEVRSLLGVFDGHKRSEPAETAARRLPELLSRSGPFMRCDTRHKTLCLLAAGLKGWQGSCQAQQLSQEVL